MKNQNKTEKQDCNKCTSSIFKEAYYCKLRLKDESVLVKSAIVDFKECSYFRKKNFKI